MLHLLPLIPLVCVVSETEADWVTRERKEEKKNERADKYRRREKKIGSVSLKCTVKCSGEKERDVSRERERKVQRDGYNEVQLDERRGHSRTKKREQRKHLTIESQFNKGNTGVAESAFNREKVEWKEGTKLSCGQRWAVAVAVAFAVAVALYSLLSLSSLSPVFCLLWKKEKRKGQMARRRTPGTSSTLSVGLGTFNSCRIKDHTQALEWGGRKAMLHTCLSSFELMCDESAHKDLRKEVSYKHKCSHSLPLSLSLSFLCERWQRERPLLWLCQSPMVTMRCRTNESTRDVRQGESSKKIQVQLHWTQRVRRDTVTNWYKWRRGEREREGERDDALTASTEPLNDFQWITLTNVSCGLLMSMSRCACD